MKPKILFLTNKDNDSPAEDVFLVDFLSKDFDLIVSHPLDCLPFLSQVKGVIIRNIWPTFDYEREWDDIKTYLREGNLPVYNPLTFKGDIEGKDYLVVLYEKGYPIIPSIDRIENISKIPSAEFYWIKPKKSCDGIGAEKLTKDELFNKNPKNYIIQPFVEFEYEPSFFYIDNKFHHAIKEKHRLLSDDVVYYDPTESDLEFAQKFVDWAALPYGIQRIDAIRTKEGKLLLTEIEDFCPYLYINDLDKDKRQKFLDDMRLSMVKAFKIENK